jgi:hypothetical protein
LRLAISFDDWRRAVFNNGSDDRATRELEIRAVLIARVCLCLLVIIAGLVLRGFGRDFGLPASIVKYGGSILWGSMVFLLVAILAPGRQRKPIALLALSVAICVELSRLIHVSWLDSFRLTTAGALLLGRIFSPLNIAAYAAGIVLGALLDRLVCSIGTKNRRRDGQKASPTRLDRNQA